VSAFAADRFAAQAQAIARMILSLRACANVAFLLCAKKKNLA